MKRVEFYTTLLENIQADNIAEDTELVNIPEWDSMSAILTLSLFDNHFGFRPDVDSFGNCKTMSEILDLANGKYE